MPVACHSECPSGGAYHVRRKWAASPRIRSSRPPTCPVHGQEQLATWGQRQVKPQPGTQAGAVPRRVMESGGRWWNATQPRQKGVMWLWHNAAVKACSATAANREQPVPSLTKPPASPQVRLVNRQSSVIHAAAYITRGRRFSVTFGKNCERIVTHR